MSTPIGQRTAFVCWNPFQLIQFREVARALPGSMFVVEERTNNLDAIDESLLLDTGVPFLIWPKSKIAELDGLFDVLVCQTMFAQAELFERTKIAMLQYGLAKEPHNYGAWRSLADLCLVYGEYSAERIKPFCPVEIVGNPRFDHWHQPNFAAQAIQHYGSRIDPNRKTVLYLPTWGEISTAEVFIDSVIDLAKNYNVLLKLHHNTDLLEKKRRDKMLDERVINFGANEDLLDMLAMADVVLSDYSGAIFDALYCEKPVILMQSDTEERIGEKLDETSLELAARDSLGPLVENPAYLKAAVKKVLEEGNQYIRENNALVERLFDRTPDAATRAAAALRRLHAGHYEQTQSQRYIRDEFLSSRRMVVRQERELNKLRPTRRTKKGKR